LKVLLVFFIGVFVAAGWLERHRHQVGTKWLVAATMVVAVSFYSLRVMS
jgi:hypothetical protein